MGAQGYGRGWRACQLVARASWLGGHAGGRHLATPWLLWLMEVADQAAVLGQLSEEEEEAEEEEEDGGNSAARGLGLRVRTLLANPGSSSSTAAAAAQAGSSSSRALADGSCC